MVATILLILSLCSFLLSVFGVSAAGLPMQPLGLLFLVAALLIEPARIVVVTRRATT